MKAPKFRPRQLVMHVPTQYVYRIVDWPRRLQINAGGERGYTYCRDSGNDITLHVATQDAMEGGEFIAWRPDMQAQYPYAIAPPVVSQEKLTDRIMAAIERVTSGHGQMRVPVDMTDPDIVLAECLTSLAVLESDALCDVIAERQRQINVEGWTAAHDDQHAGGQLAHAGAAYAFTAGQQLSTEKSLAAYLALRSTRKVPSFWPWHRAWWKPKTARADLVRAAALILAEIERIDRAAASETHAAPPVSISQEGALYEQQ